MLWAYLATSCAPLLPLLHIPCYRNALIRAYSHPPMKLWVLSYLDPCPALCQLVPLVVIISSIVSMNPVLPFEDWEGELEVLLNTTWPERPPSPLSATCVSIIESLLGRMVSCLLPRWYTRHRCLPTVINGTTHKINKPWIIMQLIVTRPSNCDHFNEC